jgi:hypothetical protein
VDSQEAAFYTEAPPLRQLSRTTDVFGVTPMSRGAREVFLPSAADETSRRLNKKEGPAFNMGLNGRNIDRPQGTVMFVRS